MQNKARKVFVHVEISLSTYGVLSTSLNYSEDERRKSWTKTFHTHRKSWQDKKLNTFITSIGRTKQTIFVKAVLTSTQAPYMFRLLLMLASLVSRDQVPNCSKGGWCYQLDKFQWKWRNDRRSERNLCNCVKKPEKNSGLQRGLNPWPREAGKVRVTLPVKSACKPELTLTRLLG